MQTNSSSPESTATTASRVVLLVEDEAVVREITAQVLKSAGYSVLETGTPSEALRVLGEYAGEVDLLLTDVVMPEMNGIELADRVRSLRANLVAVFMSGYAESDILRKVTARSAMHIQEPFTMNTLLSRVADALHATAPADVKSAPSSALCSSTPEPCSNPSAV